jgi:aldehyde dehydrogenase (NAD+)
VVLLTFRSHQEAVELANNTRYGLAASLWTDNINLALDVAPKIKAGTVWINCTNVFDAASGFGGYRESGFGREGGREGLREYVKVVVAQGRSGAAKVKKWVDPSKKVAAKSAAPQRSSAAPRIDRTAKLFIGGKQARPDSGYSTPVYDHAGKVVGEVGTGNRKDIRNAVEAAHKASGWGKGTAHNRAQVLYYLGENLSARAIEFTARLAEITGVTAKVAAAEVEASIRRLWSYAAWADKWEGAVHRTPYRNVTLAMPEPIGVIGIAGPRESPLLGFVSTVAPAIAMGNTTVVVPSERAPLIATDLYQVIETSDVPAGVINIVTGPRDELAGVLAAHDDVDGIWYFGSAKGSGDVEKLSAGNLKRTWVSYGAGRDWTDPAGEGREFLEEATQVKNIWVPYGE